ncbi:MAG: DNA polymerase III subunit delta' [SAR324 cluster bacterium]|nr:DNA polymerase III subunit delta' [SAR324 cluster bacterium]
MAFSEILGQDSAVALLKKSIQNQRIPSAFLFTGPNHIGKQKTMTAVAQNLNCLRGGEDACLSCDACLQIAHQSFPDYSMVVPDGKFIKIDQIKEALKWLHLRSNTGNYRVLGIKNAEKLNKESANAFLKTLEEPPAQTLIILSAENSQQLLETIVSRCQIIQFRLLKKDHVQSILTAHQNLTREQIAFLSCFAMGKVPLDWIEKVDLLQTLRENIIEFLISLSAARMEEIFNTIAKWGPAKEKEWAYMLDFLEFWFRDLDWLAHDLHEDSLINQDRIKQIRICLQQFHPQQIRVTYNKIIQTRERIVMNAHVSLAMEALWIYIKRNLAI